MLTHIIGLILLVVFAFSIVDYDHMADIVFVLRSIFNILF